MKRTFQPKKVIKKNKHGFLKRAKTKAGKKILKRRRLKKRSTLSG